MVSKLHRLVSLAFTLASFLVIFYFTNANAQAGLPPGACNGFTASAQAANSANDVARAQTLKRSNTLYQNCARAKQLIDSTRPPPPSREELAWTSANGCEAVTTFINNYPRSRHASEAAARKARVCTPPPNCNEYSNQVRAAAARRDMAVLRLLRGQTRNYQACPAARNAINVALAPSIAKAKEKEAPLPPVPDPVPMQMPVLEPVPEPLPLPLPDTTQTTTTPPPQNEQVAAPVSILPLGASNSNTTPVPANVPPIVVDLKPVVIDPPAVVIEPPPIFEVPPAIVPPTPVWLYRPIGSTSDGGTLYYANDFAKAAPVLQNECGQQNWGSCALLAAIYGDGLGVAVDFDRAFNYSRMACDNSIMLGCVFLGQRYLQSGGTEENNSRAAELFNNSCEAGEPDGCNALAEANRTGTGVARNNEKSNIAYARAAQGFRAYCNAGRTSYCGLIGMLYLQGFGVEKDETLAQALFRQGCDGKDEPSCFMIANSSQ
jgi:hypothetical protein